MMAARAKPPGMWEALNAINDEEVYAAFLRGRSQSGDHGFLLAAIRRSNLRPSVRKVVEELITGKLRRLKHRAPSNETDVKNAYRALCVLDLEAAGWDKRESAIEEAKMQLKCGRRTIEKALGEFEDMLRGADQEFLDNMRSAFKSPT
jgi:hypothetical protein